MRSRLATTVWLDGSVIGSSALSARGVRSRMTSLTRKS